MAQTLVYKTMSGGRGLSFVSEVDIGEKRQKRQEEWEKVRKPDEPLGKQINTILSFVILMYETLHLDNYVRVLFSYSWQGVSLYDYHRYIVFM